MFKKREILTKGIEFVKNGFFLRKKRKISSFSYFTKIKKRKKRGGDLDGIRTVYGKKGNVEGRLQRFEFSGAQSFSRSF